MIKKEIVAKIKKLLAYKKQTVNLTDAEYISIIQCYSKNGKYFKNDFEALKALKHVIERCDFKESDFKIIRVYGKFVQEQNEHIQDTNS